MKPGLNIQPTSHNTHDLHLLAELGNYGAFFLWFTKSPISVKGLISFDFSGVDVDLDIEAAVKGLPATPKVSTTTISLDFKESILVPEKYNAGVNEKALALMFGEDNETVVTIDHVTSSAIYNHYRITKKEESVIRKYFPNATVFHSTSLQLEQLNGSDNLLYCIIFHNTIKVILFKNSTLQIVQQYSYIVPEDVVYHLLNTCEQHNLNTSEIHLTLSGMIDEQSKLYNEIYRYFLHITFDKVDEDIVLPAEISEHPRHFFSHLTALASCV